MNQFPVAKNKLQNILQKTHVQSQSPVDEQHNWSYGAITEVNSENSQVKVKLFTKNNDLENREILGGAFLPLMNPLTQIHHQWGALREGLIVRVHWRGKMDQKTCIVEVIADEETSFLSKEATPNELPTGPFRLFQSGF